MAITKVKIAGANLGSLKTVGGQSIVGTGDISVVSSVPEVKQPVNGSPASGATGTTVRPTLTGSTYYSLYGVAMAASQWQVSTVNTFATTVVSTGDVAGTSTSYTLTSDLPLSTQHFWRVRYKDSNGVYSDWSTGTSFTTTANVINQPSNSSPANAATNITETPTLTGSAFSSINGSTMAASQWQVSTVNTFATTVVSTGDVAGTSTSYTVSAGVLQVNTQYFWRVRYKNNAGVYSDWSTGTSFTTAATFGPYYIPTPTATPAAFGDALDGGFYTGLIWGQVTQSATSKTLATGSQTFAVTTNMASTPLFYSGQTLEIRSRANPTNHFKCTVTGASGTTLTVNVTSISGSGTFSDWSVMSRYRMIVAPKASGHSDSLANKNSNDAAPTACQTLTEGRLATLAMVAAGNSTVYPAAHFCNGLNIGGYTDWFLPARDQLELGWRNLKPTADNNYTTADRPNPGAPWSSASLGSYGDTANTHGTNNNSAPAGTAYTAGVPAQVANTSFRTGGAEAFNYGSSYYWSSSEYSSTNAWFQYWYTSEPGRQNNTSKSNSGSVRAFRQSII